MSRELSVAEVARTRGLHRSTVYRWFVELERVHGASVIGRRGRKLFTTDDALEKVAPACKMRDREERRLRELEARVDDVEVRADKHAEQIGDLSREFRKLAARRFAPASSS